VAFVSQSQPKHFIQMYLSVLSSRQTLWMSGTIVYYRK